MTHELSELQGKILEVVWFDPTTKPTNNTFTLMAVGNEWVELFNEECHIITRLVDVEHFIIKSA